MKGIVFFLLAGLARRIRGGQLGKVSRRRKLKTPLVLLASMLTALAWDAPAHANFWVEASGQWFCSLGVGQGEVPMSGVRVELWDQDCPADPLGVCDTRMAVGVTDQNGRFKIGGFGGDGWNYHWSRPDVYIKLFFTDDLAQGPRGVRVINDLHQIRSSWSHTVSNVEGPIDFGVLISDYGIQPGWSSTCQLWLAMRRAFQDYVADVGRLPPAGHAQVLHWSGLYGLYGPLGSTASPWANLDTVHWPTNYPGRTHDSYGVPLTHAHIVGIMRHEFGHTVRHSYDGDANHFALDAGFFRYARPHEHCDSKHIGEIDWARRGFAFNEGWAQYWAGKTWSCGGNWWDDLTVEGNVAVGLAELQRQCRLNHEQMVDVLAAAPGQIHSFEEFENWARALYPGCTGVRGTPPVTRSGSPLTIGDVPAADWRAMIADRLARIDQRILEIKSDIRDAKMQLSARPDCLVPENCMAAFEAYAKPALLSGALRKLVLVERLYRKSQEYPRLDLPAESAQSVLDRLRGKVGKKLARTTLATYTKVLRAVSHLREQSAEANTLYEELQGKAEALRRALATGADILQMVDPLDEILANRATPASENTLRRPDLVVTDIRVSSAPSGCRVTYDLLNNGAADAPETTTGVDVVWGSGDVTSEHSETVAQEDLAAGEVVEISLTIPLPCGPLEVAVTADVDDAAKESDESNNWRREFF